MSMISPTLRARFAKLPKVAGEVWQGGLVRVPTWVQDAPDKKLYRPWAGFWVSLRTGLVNMTMQREDGGRDPEPALSALLEFGLNRKLAGCRPERLEVTDEQTAAYLKRELGEIGLQVAVTKDPSGIRDMLRQLAESMSHGPLPPTALEARGVTVERMRAFAEAAAAFYRAAPWRHLTDEDLVHIEAPAPPQGLGYCSVLGAAGHTFGLGFYRNPGDLDALQDAEDPKALLEAEDRWSVLYGPLSDLPFGDVDLWEDHALAVAGEEAYPLVAEFGPKGIERPDAKVLAYLEGLLHVLAKSSEEEIDRGRWSHEVGTQDGPVQFTLAILSLLAPLDAPAGGTMLEQAQELVYRALEARGRRQVQLARKALELSPDCADAYVLLAEQSMDLEAVRGLYEQGVAAGERALGPKAFAEGVGHFWGIIETRPYMRARLGLANALEDLGRTDEAVGHYQELLRLNPDDNQGVRDILLPLFLETGRDAEAGALLRQFEQDGSAVWAYGWALWAFRQDRDSEAARKRLREAIRANRRVPDYLTGEVEMPEVLPESYAVGSEEEAILCADTLWEAWEAAPGALHWLEDHSVKAKPKKRRRK